MKKHRFNELKPPKPIHVIAACVLELVDDPTTPALCAERFIDGADLNFSVTCSRVDAVQARACEKTQV